MKNQIEKFVRKAQSTGNLPNNFSIYYLNNVQDSPIWVSRDSLYVNLHYAEKYGEAFLKYQIAKFLRCPNESVYFKLFKKDSPLFWKACSIEENVYAYEYLKSTEGWSLKSVINKILHEVEHKDIDKGKTEVLLELAGIVLSIYANKNNKDIIIIVPSYIRKKSLSLLSVIIDAEVYTEKLCSQAKIKSALHRLLRTKVSNSSEYQIALHLFVTDLLIHSTNTKLFEL